MKDRTQEKKGIEREEECTGMSEGNKRKEDAGGSDGRGEGKTGWRATVTKDGRIGGREEG